VVVIRTGWVGNTVKLLRVQKRGLELQVSAVNSRTLMLTEGEWTDPNVAVTVRRPAGHRGDVLGCSLVGARNYSLSKRRLLLSQHHISRTAVRTSHLGSFWHCSSLSPMKHQVRTAVALSVLSASSVRAVHNLIHSHVLQIIVFVN
jgi:hypothetical protein